MNTRKCTHGVQNCYHILQKSRIVSYVKSTHSCEIHRLGNSWTMTINHKNKPGPLRCYRDCHYTDCRESRCTGVQCCKACSWDNTSNRIVVVYNGTYNVHTVKPETTEADKPGFRHPGTYPKKPTRFFWVHPTKKPTPPQKKRTLLL